MRPIFFATLLAAAPMTAFADEGLQIHDGYARSANPVTGAAFMTIDNLGDADCPLQNVSSDIAERTELHTHREEDGVMKMMHVEGGFVVPAGGSLDLKRGGDHVMFLGLENSLHDGDKVALQLDFGSCGIQTTELVVDNERKPTDGHGMHGDM
ncbi:copper chaperone PCu(A)C [Paracoccus sp. Z330]|uniref:Copper chaperone PCu(A)C n=1 Tax=Paracoccus onchidii TaxID=3017813 RepID=A0ABT4ZBV5_9RHOB|nr:copper chaperone PCu(A)C [Paracoccus onchidii]MDB6176844.1 copper chaperone PCu(A)C [Paracoccus onchidii]